MSVDSQYLNSGLAQTTCTGDPGAVPRYDTNGAFVQNVLRVSVASLTASASLDYSAGVFVFTPGTSGVTATLPPASNAASLAYIVVNTNTNTTTVVPSSSDTINGSTNSATLNTAYASNRFISTGAAWLKL
jgi:hypothetical protein